MVWLVILGYLLRRENQICSSALKAGSHAICTRIEIIQRDRLCRRAAPVLLNEESNGVSLPTSHFRAFGQRLYVSNGSAKNERRSLHRLTRRRKRYTSTCGCAGGPAAQNEPSGRRGEALTDGKGSFRHGECLYTKGPP